jgi:hypothetical protein
VGTEYVGRAFVVGPDGDETEVTASLRSNGDERCGSLTGPADWLTIAGSTERSSSFDSPDGQSGACFLSEFDQTATMQRVTIAREPEREAPATNTPSCSTSACARKERRPR